MKKVIQIPIIKKHDYLCNATIEERGEMYLVEWNYQRTSWSCQGQWATWHESIPKTQYSLDNCLRRLKLFIKQEYKL